MTGHHEEHPDDRQLNPWADPDPLADFDLSAWLKDKETDR